MIFPQMWYIQEDIFSLKSRYIEFPHTFTICKDLFILLTSKDDICEDNWNINIFMLTKYILLSKIRIYEVYTDLNKQVNYKWNEGSYFLR